MIPVASFAGKEVAVFGLGESGRATAAALVAGGATVAAWDDGGDAVAAAKAAGIATEDLRVADWRRFAALVLAPGVPLTHPEPHWSVTAARNAGVEIVGDIELFCRERRRHDTDAAFVAVTGTNGKSTTAALIAHLLRTAGRDVQLGGNIGTAILSLEPPQTGRTHVVECSSFQIDLAPSLDPSIGVLLNITADHLDRHGTLDAYAAIKERLVAGAPSAVIGVDDRWCQAIADRAENGGRRVIRISTRRPLADGIYSEGFELVAAAGGAATSIASLHGIGSLRGMHNAENAAAAVAVARMLSLDVTTIVSGLRSFAGLPHRMEEVGRQGRVVFVNDSKATNADAAAKALACFRPIYWIAGGRPKEGGIAGLSEFFQRIAKAYLIGEAVDDFARTLEGKVPYQRAGTLAVAVTAAAADAAGDPAAEPVVLLSPACASYDQFENFARRGDAFRAVVRELDGVTSQGEAA